MKEKDGKAGKREDLDEELGEKLRSPADDEGMKDFSLMEPKKKLKEMEEKEIESKISKSAYAAFRSLKFPVEKEKAKADMIYKMDKIREMKLKEKKDGNAGKQKEDLDEELGEKWRSPADEGMNDFSLMEPNERLNMLKEMEEKEIESKNSEGPYSSLRSFKFTVEEKEKAKANIGSSLLGGRIHCDPCFDKSKACCLREL